MYGQTDHRGDRRNGTMFRFQWNPKARKFVFIFARPRLGFADLVQIDREIDWALNHPNLIACRVDTPAFSPWSTLAKWDVIFDCGVMQHVDSEFIPIHIASIALRLRASGAFVFLSALVPREAFVKALGRRLLADLELDDAMSSIRTRPFPGADDTAVQPEPPIEGP